LSGLPRATKQLGVSIGAVAFSPDGSLVAAIGRKHTPGATPPLGFAAVWRTSDGALLWKETRPEGPGDTLAFSQDGRRLALSFERWYSNNGIDEVVSARSGRREQTIRPAGSTQSLAFAPDGALATGSWQGIVQLWRGSSPKELGHALLALPAPVGSIAFDPRGDEFATGGGSGGFVKLWDAKTLQQVGTALPGSPGKWANALFTPSGSQLLTLYDDGHGALWPMSLAAWEAQACRVAGRNLTREEWSRYVTGRPYAHVCT
jgi:WD40 repeat protein